MAGGRLTCVVACATTAVLGSFTAAAHAAHTPIGVGDLFAPDSYVEKPLAADAPLDPSSATMVSTLAAEVDQGLAQPRPQDKPNVDYQWCSPRVYTVPRYQPPVPVKLPPDASQKLKDQIGMVPIPPWAQTSDVCTDKPLVIWQPSTDTVWELFVADKDDLGQWSAVYGGKIGPDPLITGLRGVSQNPGHWEDPPNGWGRRFGMSATSIPKLAGLPRISEIQSGSVGHAVLFTMRYPAPCWRWPAQRMDGLISVPDQNNASAPPYGAILRLPASLNIDAMPISRFTKAIAKGVQRHGMVLGDRGRVGLAVETPPRILGEPLHDNDPDPYIPYFDGRSGPQIVDEFPWEQLQVLAARPGTNPCQTQ